MKKLVATAFVICALSVPAARADDQKFHSEVDMKKTDGGNYEQKVTTDSTDAQGTRVQREDSEQGKETLTGGTKVTTKSSTTTDPKGMMNKKTDKAEVVVKTDKSGNVERKYSADSVDAANTAHKTRSETDTEVKNGLAKTTTETKHIDDPKGMLNKTVTKTKTTEQQNADGTTTTTVKKEKDGNLLESNTQTH